MRALSEAPLLRRGQAAAAPVDEVKDPPWAEVERPAFAKVERRKTERRSMDALRSEALRSVIEMVEDKNFGGLRNRVQGRRGMIPWSRIALLLVALAAGGAAAFLATQQQPQPAATIVQEIKAPTTQILVAKQAISVGQRLAPDSLEWIDWPEQALRPEYVTVAAAPEAMTQMAGSVARFEFFAGEPIRAEKLAPAGGGFLSALLETGKRGVSVSVAAESASGGFVVPNDHVDVVLTRASDIAGQDSQTILHNVRVLAINARLGETGANGAPADAAAPSTDVFSNDAIATLELDPTQAEVIINATGMGKLSLMLRPTSDSAEAGSVDQRAANAAIRISSPFWSKK
jgi:pilus assembly protein CpaB